MGTRVAVVSDTHGPRRWKSCPPGVAKHLRTADLILHAGDVCVAPVLDELAQYAPVHVVIGNNDGPDVAQWGATPTASLSIDGFPVAMIHNTPRPHRPVELTHASNSQRYGLTHASNSQRYGLTHASDSQRYGLTHARELAVVTRDRQRAQTVTTHHRQRAQTVTTHHRQRAQRRGGSPAPTTHQMGPVAAGWGR